MALHIVETFENDIFERDAALVLPIVFFDFVDYLSDAISLFGWHDFDSFVGERVVKRDCKVAFCFVEELFHTRDETYARYGYATWTPSETPIGSQDFASAKDFESIVERFAHTHKYDVSEAIDFGDTTYLVHDFGSSEATAPTLFASHAELAIHFAAHLARYAESSTIVFGDEDRFYLTVSSLEKIFFSAVDRSSRPTRFGDTNAIFSFEGISTFD